MNIGLYFGSFNPIHIGHLIIANHFVQHSDLDAVWMVVSPQNPAKPKKTLLNDRLRYEMVAIALEDYDNIRPCDIEFGLPKPSYTIHTLVYLKEKYPLHNFQLLLGADNLAGFHKWKNHREILEDHHLYVYPRVTNTHKESRIDPDKITHIKAPIIEISASDIRTQIKERKEVRPLLPPSVWRYIQKWGFYET